MSLETLLLFIPELILLLVGTGIFVASGWVSRPTLWRWLALGALILALGVLPLEPEQVSHLAQRELVSDTLSQYLRSLAIIAGILLVLTAWEPLPQGPTAEYLGCLLFAQAGAMVACAAKDMVTLFLGLELVSIPTYILLFLGRRDRTNYEATLKYFFLSVLASALFLYGLSFLYGMAGTTDLGSVAARLSPISPQDPSAWVPVAVVALVLIGAALAFKIAAAPFHFYAPDVYQGTSYLNAAVLSVLPKLAGLAVLVRVFCIVWPTVFQQPWQLLMLLALISMTVGNVAALWQNHLRRLLAYSSIAHSGYMLMGLSAFAAIRPVGTIDPESAAAVWNGVASTGFYLLVYLLATLGVFAALVSLRGANGEVNRIEELGGLAWSEQPGSRVLAWSLAICLFSLTGVPPLAGFWGKLAVFASALSVPPAEADIFGWFVLLALVGAINAAIGAAYYLRVIGTMFFGEMRSPVGLSRQPGPLLAALIASMLVVAIGLWWQPWFDRAVAASPPVGGGARAEASLGADSSAMRLVTKHLLGVENTLSNVENFRENHAAGSLE